MHHHRAKGICRALAAAGAAGGCRTPDRLRLGLAPINTRFVDVRHAMHRLRQIVAGDPDTGRPA
jgi:kynureninase